MTKTKEETQGLPEKSPPVRCQETTGASERRSIATPPTSRRFTRASSGELSAKGGLCDPCRYSQHT